jgi:hypothetical protein
VDVVERVRFRWFWGLTCDFWAEFEEIIFATTSFWFSLLAFGRGHELEWLAVPIVS